MIIVIIAITIIVIRIIEVKVIRIMNIVIIEIRIEILQGASLGMGSLHIKVIVSDIEGRDYNINIQTEVLMWLYFYNKEHTGPYLMSSHGKSIAYCIPHLSNAIKPPHSCTESWYGAEEGHQSNYPHQGAWKANPDICPG